MSYELFVGPEVDYWKSVALLDIVTQTQVIEGKWNGEVLTIDKPDSVILGARSLESVEFNLRARLRETEPFSDVITNAEDSTENGGVEPPIPERPDLDNVIGATHWAMTPDGEKLIYRITDTVSLWAPYSKVWIAPGTIPYTLLTIGDVPDVDITRLDSEPFRVLPALATQVGGSHYKDMPIQPAEYCHKNGIGKLEGDVIAYVSRWRKKNGIEDLKKARHTIDIIIELEGGETHHG